MIFDDKKGCHRSARAGQYFMTNWISTNDILPHKRVLGKNFLPTNFTSKTRAIIPAAIGDEAEVPVWDEVHLHSTFSDSIGYICQILAILVRYYLIWHIFLLFLVIKIFIILNLPSMKVCCDHFPLTSPERMASKEMQKWNNLISNT